MSDFQVARWRPAPFLPEADSRDGSLTFVVAVLCFLACLTLLTVLAADRAARDWTDQLQGEATVLVRPKANETPDGAAARAAETLAGVSGVAEARALEREKAEALIAPWLGDADLSDLPVPRLVAVQLTPEAPAPNKPAMAAMRAKRSWNSRAMKLSSAPDRCSTSTRLSTIIPSGWPTSSALRAWPAGRGWRSSA